MSLTITNQFPVYLLPVDTLSHFHGVSLRWVGILLTSTYSLSRTEVLKHCVGSQWVQRRKLYVTNRDRPLCQKLWMIDFFSLLLHNGKINSTFLKPLSFSYLFILFFLFNSSNCNLLKENRQKIWSVYGSHRLRGFSKLKVILPEY